MKIYWCILLFISVVIPLGNSLASETIKWQLSETGELFDIASRYRSQETLPDEVTQVLMSNDIRLVGDRVIRHVRAIRFYPTSRDIENYGVHSVYFNEKNEKLTILSAASVNNQGEVKSISPSSVQVLDTDNYRSFSDSKEVVLTIPGLTNGSLAVIEYEVVRDRSRQEADWSNIFFTQRGYPIKQFTLSVSWPDSQPVNWAAKSPHVTCNEKTGGLVCSGSNIPPFKDDNNINWRDHIGQIAVGELQSWQQVIDTSSKAMNQALSDTTGTDQLLKNLLAGSKDREEQINRIHEFVARDIRYVSMSELGHTITPHNIASIIKNRYGDCKDKSMLLHALLRRIGIEPYPVLIATDRTAPGELLIPTLNYFDHVVTCFDDGGQQYCLDATDQDTFWKFTPAWIQNKVSLPLKPNQKPSRVINSRFRWKMDISTQITFNKNGGQNEGQERKYYGEYASSMRNLLLGKSQAEREEWLTRQYHDEVTTYADPLFHILELQEMGPELAIYSNGEISPFLDIKKDLIYEENDAWLKDELEIMRLQNKHYDEHFAGLKLRSEYIYDTDGLWTITSTSPVLNFIHDFGSMQRQVDLNGQGKLTVTTELMIPEQTIKQNQIEDFNAFLELLIRESLIRFNGKLAIKK